jgi:hypothetical protein
LLDQGHRPSPQTTISTNIFASFYDVDHNEEYKATIDWLKLNKVGERLGIDITDKKNSFGYIKLGNFVKPPEWVNLSNDEIIAQISPYSEIKSYHMSIGS